LYTKQFFLSCDNVESDWASYTRRISMGLYQFSFYIHSRMIPCVHFIFHIYSHFHFQRSHYYLGFFWQKKMPLLSFDNHDMHIEFSETLHYQRHYLTQRYHLRRQQDPIQLFYLAYPHASHAIANIVHILEFLDRYLDILLLFFFHNYLL
jgi:hypothetical protein